MKALITGASSGIGRDIARVLASQGCDLIIAARRRERLEELKQELTVSVQIECCDLSNPKECLALYQRVKSEQIDILINNAGFGLCGYFSDSDLERELQMINTNISALHILTKCFLKDFLQRGSGQILNIASSAAFFPGPLMATYYASKAYVLHLTEALREEVRRQNAGIYVGALCPGPVKTEFDKTANVTFSLKGLDSYRLAEYTIKKMKKGTKLIIPGLSMKFAYFFHRFLPKTLLLRCVYHFQKKKTKNSESL